MSFRISCQQCLNSSREWLRGSSDDCERLLRLGALFGERVAFRSGSPASQLYVEYKLLRLLALVPSLSPWFP